MFKSKKITQPINHTVLILHKNEENLLGAALPHSVKKDRLDPYSVKQLVSRFSLRYALNFSKLLRSIKCVLIHAQPKDSYTTLFFKALHTHLLCAVLAKLEPRLIITFIHDCVVLRRLTWMQPDIQFISVQNGFNRERDYFELRTTARLQKRQNWWFACFGDHDVSLCATNEHPPGRAIPIGSVRYSAFSHDCLNEYTKDEFDICLISHWNLENYRRFKKGDSNPEGSLYWSYRQLELIAHFLGEFVKTNKEKKVAIICRSSSNIETKFYHSFFDSDLNITVVPKTNERFGSYNIARSSNVIVTLESTLGFEMLGAGKKVYFCNPLGNYFFKLEDAFDAYGEPVDHVAFKDEVLRLLQLSEDQYKIRTQKFADMMMNSGVNAGALPSLRKLVREALD